MRETSFDWAGQQGSSWRMRRFAARLPLARGACLLSVSLLAVLALVLMPASASAESLCTDTWVGPAAGSWVTASDWSAGVPTSSSVACIGSGDTVTVSEGAQQTEVLQGAGALVLSGGSIELVNAFEASSIASLSLSGGTLTGAGKLEVSTSLSWTAGTMSGSGSTVLKSGSEGTINPGSSSSVFLAERDLVNHGMLTWSTGTVSGSKNAEIDNSGTFDVNGESSAAVWPERGLVDSDESNVWLHNTGTVQKTAGTEYTHIGFQSDNEGVIAAKAGAKIIMSGGTHGTSVETGSWVGEGSTEMSFNKGTYSWGAATKISGPWELAENARINAKSINGEASHLRILRYPSYNSPSVGATLALTESGATSQLKELEMTLAGPTSPETTLTGAGTLEVSTSLSWTAGTMSGSGSTVLKSGSEGTINPGSSSSVFLAERDLVNHGMLTWSTGTVSGSKNAEIDNSGTFDVNGESSAAVWPERGLVDSDESNVWLHNTGTVQKTAGTEYTHIGFQSDNEGVIAAKAGAKIIMSGGTHGTSVETGSWVGEGSTEMSFNKGTYSWSAATKISGPWELAENARINAKSIQGEASHLRILRYPSYNSPSVGAALALTEAGATSKVKELEMTLAGPTSPETTLTGAGTLEVSTSLSWTAGTMSGSGSTVLGSGSIATIENGSETVSLTGRGLVNDGTATLATGILAVSEGAKITNSGTFKANSESGSTQITTGFGGASIVNSGTFEKTAGTGTTTVAPTFENKGIVSHGSGTLVISNPVRAESRTQYGTSNPSSLGPAPPCSGKPVDCATGNETETQTDIAVGGRGMGLDLMRYYNAQAAAKGEHGAFGYGWSNSFSDRLVYSESAKTATVVQANGSTVTFNEESSTWKAPAWSDDKLTGASSEGYTLKMSDQTIYKFSGAGRLESVTNRNGNTTTLGYNEEGQLETITDPAGRTIKLAYNAEGLVESATDPMGHTVKYTYESGNLASVTLPAQSTPRWKFKYDSSHRLTSIVNGIGGETTNTYNSADQVTVQKESSGTTLKWEYETFQTQITNEATGSVTLEDYSSADQLTAITHGYGTEHATTESFTYNEAGQPLTHTDGNGHTTTYEYNGEADKTSETDPEGHETKWTYNTEHEITTTTLPSGETTSIEYDEHGNPTKVSRPAPKEETQETLYEYNSRGEMTVMIDPMKHKWTYGYDEAGDRTSKTDPEGDTTTWSYNADSQQTSEVAPAGNVEGGKPSEYTTSIERNALGEPVKVTKPEGQETLYEYNADGDQTTVTDANGHTTTTTYNTEDQPIKVTQPSGATQETEYDGAGQIVKQTDGNEHATTYARNVLGEIIEETNPLEHKTKKTYDAAGNLATITDASGRTTTYSHNKENELTKISYSESSTHTVEDEYTPNGQLTSMSDGTGTTSYSYDQLGRLTETKNGHGDVVGYGYDLANEITQITYPNGKIVKDGYDKAGRLNSVADWLSHTISFSYTPESQVATESFPETSGESDHYAYTRTGELVETTMLKGSETLAAIAYKHDSMGQLTKATQNGLPGNETTEYAYTINGQLEKAGSTGYEYNAAGNPTKIGTTSQTFSAADELEKAGTTTDTYNEVGQHTKTTPETGPATTYGYDQAGNLTSANRPEQGETPKIEDSYTYDGTGLRAAETINSTTHHLTWQLTSALPLLLSDGNNSYIYGTAGTPIEQINNTTEKVQYLHHDQQGSTRLITGSTGTAEGAYTYTPYGAVQEHTGTATTPLDYDSQYTSNDTGLIYMRAREYDPATAQFLSVDPLEAITGAPYNYAGDNPLNEADPTGLGNWLNLGIQSPGEVAETLNPVKYYEEEIESYENGCGYLASVAHGLEGAVVGALDASGVGEGEAALGEEGGAAIEAEITGFTKHGLAQAISREGVGVNEQAMLDAVNAPSKVIDQADGTTRFVGKDATVVLNREGHVVTTWANSSDGTRIQP